MKKSQQTLPPLAKKEWRERHKEKIYFHLKLLPNLRRELVEWFLDILWNTAAATASRPARRSGRQTDGRTAGRSLARPPVSGSECGRKEESMLLEEMLTKAATAAASNESGARDTDNFWGLASLRHGLTSTGLAFTRNDNDP